MEGIRGKTKWSTLESRREREVMRYAELLGSLGLLHSTDGPKSSRDSALTAYAQLVALRLNGKRVIISLIGREHQYVLTEATRTLSLQNDAVHEPSDAIRWGMAMLPLDTSLCRFTMQNDEPGPLGRCGQAVIIPDLKLDALCAQHPTVLEQPFTRSFASVPLMTTSRIAIGALTLLDDKPRYDFSETDTIFMRDVGATIMSHLDMRCAYYAHERALRMTRGLGHLVSGNDASADAEDYRSLLNWPLPSVTRENHTSMAERTEEDVTGTADQGLQLDMLSNGLGSVSIEESLPETLGHDNVSISAPLNNSTRPVPGDDEQTAVSPSIHPNVLSRDPRTEDIQETLLSSGVRQTFERAATILQNGMDVTGVVFFDASVKRFSGGGVAGLDGLTTSTSENSGKNSDVSQDSSSDSAPRVSKDSEYMSAKRRKSCKVLGLAIKNDFAKDLQQSRAPTKVTESFLKSLLRRFPRGKVWTFGVDGSLSSDSKSESSSAVEATHESIAKLGGGADAREKTTPRTASEKLHRIFPGVKSLALMPLWDSHRERNFAASLVWSCEPYRALSSHDDIPFLAAFGDVIMAEVGRLDAQTESRSKTKFISSVSHELRSPLHGIIGATEVLQNRDNIALHEEMLHMIQGCSRSLMDIIDHLLDHAQTVVSSPPSYLGESDGSNRSVVEPYSRHSFGQKVVEESCNISSVAQEVMDACLWSAPKAAAESKSEHDRPSTQSASTEPLKVALEVLPSGLEHDWTFNISAGAWRRLVLNLVSNSIKYTDPGGYLKISLSTQDMPSTQRSTGRELVQLECLDNGRGMSQEYLNNGLWKAFSQEDGHAQGTGLGLSLVHGIVKELGGKLGVESQKGIGTKITISIPLTRAKRRESSLVPAISWQEGQVLQGMTVALLGFDRDQAQNKRYIESMQVLRASVANTCRSLGLVCVEDSTDADFYLLTEVAARSTAILIQQLAEKNLERRVIVLCHSAAAAQLLTTSRTAQFTDAVFVSQPIGPQKLQRCFSNSLNRRRDSVKTYNEAGSSPGPPVSSNIAASPSLRPYNDPSGLPLRRFSPQSSSQWPIPPPKCSVLLVEDNEINLRLLQAYMKKSGHYQISAKNGLEALNTYKEALRIADEAQTLGGVANMPPTVILMDINMPVMDGFESTRRIRAFERASRIQPSLIVALTALSSHDARQKAHLSGVDHFVTKPLKLHELRYVLDLHRPSHTHSNDHVTTLA